MTTVLKLKIFWDIKLNLSKFTLIKKLSFKMIKTNQGYCKPENVAERQI